MAKRVQLDEIRPILNEVNEGISRVDGVLDTVEAGADKVTDILEHGLEKVADVIPDALDTGVHAVTEGARLGAHALQSPRKLVLLVTLGGAILGVGTGVGVYFLAKRRLENRLRKDFEEKLDVEIEGMRKFYEKRTTKKQPFVSPEKAAENLLPKSREERLAEEAANALNEYEGAEPPPGIIPVENDPREGVNHRVRYDKAPRRSSTSAESTPREETADVMSNVFVNPVEIDGWDQEYEERNRDVTLPYVISHDEYMGSELDDQRTLTYYSADNVLVDEREVPIDDVDLVVGEKNLARFGDGSRDSNVVYIRNERIEVDFEVALSRGSYAEEVAGFQHSDLPASRYRKGRRDDDE